MAWSEGRAHRAPSRAVRAAECLALVAAAVLFVFGLLLVLKLVMEFDPAPPPSL